MKTGRKVESISRRDWCRLAALGVAGVSMSGWFERLASAAATDPRRKSRCILLWMTGGPSQLETFDPKPGNANGGPGKAIATAAPGMQISENLPLLAQQARRLSIVRSMTTKEGDHQRATYLLRTGHLPQGPIHFPTLGSLLSKELGEEDAEMPGFVSVAPYRFLSPGAYGPGFLGPRYAPLVVGEAGFNAARPGGNAYESALRVKNLDLPGGVERAQADARLALREEMQAEFASTRPGPIESSQSAAYRAAVRMMRSEASRAFALEDEPGAVRDAYGRNDFGQGCLLARRLIERGVPFVEVSLNGVQGGNTLGWDTHQNNFTAVKSLCGVLDPAWATLLSDLDARGLLDSTLIVWMGEFGRTPKINAAGGRDHFPNAWSAVLCGGGIRGGQVVGRTSPNGMEIQDRPVSVQDLVATICLALGLDPSTQNLSNVGRPIRLAEPNSKPIKELVAI